MKLCRSFLRIILAAGMMWLFSVSVALAADIVFQVEQTGNLDLDAQKLAEVLASDAVEVRITMAPLLALPGWTGRIGLCGVRDICLRKRWRSVFLRDSKVARAENSLHFHVPAWHWFGLMPYRPAGPVRVSLPPFWPGELPVNIDTTLASLREAAGLRQVADMHLPPPYFGVASWRLGAGNEQGHPAPVWRMAACDPVVTASQATEPRVHPYRQATAYVDWMSSLAGNPWWAAQLKDVQQEQGDVQEGAQPMAWRRVTVAKEHETLRYLRVDEARLMSSTCPGSTRHEFTWRNGKLLGASMREMPGIFAGDEACDAAMAGSREALWWEGDLQRHSHVGPAGLQVWERWREMDPDCRHGSGAAIPDAVDLVGEAERWWRLVGEAR